MENTWFCVVLLAIDLQMQRVAQVFILNWVMNFRIREPIHPIHPKDETLIAWNLITVNQQKSLLPSVGIRT